MAFDITPYINMKPAEVRALIREGKIDFPTAGMCAGYAQANLVILPPEYAADFEEYTKLNPFPCPVLEIIRGKEPLTHAMGKTSLYIFTFYQWKYVYSINKSVHMRKHFVPLILSESRKNDFGDENLQI